MNQIIHCPSCNRPLRVPDDLLGRPVRCPSCSTEFTAVGNGGAAPPEARDESGAGPAREPPFLAGEHVTDQPGPDATRERPVRDRYARDDEQDEDYPRYRHSRESASSKVTGPAIGLMICGGLAVAISIVGFVLNVALVGLGRPNRPGAGADEAIANMIGGVVGAILGLCWGGIILVGANKMRKLQSHGYAMAAAIIAMLPCNACCLLGLPFGIWAVVMLNDPEVKSAFR
jgi:predicted Zn finger-like uncharacterized protein